MKLRSFLNAFLQHVLGRSVSLDPAIPTRVLIGQGLSMVAGLLRGLLLTRQCLILESGARISDTGRLKVGGGLVRIGAHSRVECTASEGVELGRNFKLGAFSRMVASGTMSDLGHGISVGDDVGISEFAYIGGAGGVRIGSDTIVGQYFSMHPENHVFATTERPIREQSIVRRGIEIGPDCWIGAKVTILDGVVLGRGSVVAAGSVVNRSFPDFAVIGGVPARLLRLRQKADFNGGSNTLDIPNG